MGSFFGNVHVLLPPGTTAKQATSRIKRALVSTDTGESPRADGPASTIVMGRSNRWIVLFETDSQGQDIAALESIAEVASRAMSSVAITVSVHDSDVLDMRLFDSGKRIDAYNSKPEVQGAPDAQTPPSFAGSAMLWKNALIAGRPDDLRAVWDSETVFQEDSLQSLSGFFGIKLQTLFAGAASGDEPLDGFSSFVVHLPRRGAGAGHAPKASPPAVRGGKIALPEFLYGTADAVAAAINEEAKRWAEAFVRERSLPSPHCVPVQNGTEAILGDGVGQVRASSNEWRLCDLQQFRKQVLEQIQALGGIVDEATSKALAAHVESFPWGNIFALCDPDEEPTLRELAQRISRMCESWEALEELSYLNWGPAAFTTPKPHPYEVWWQVVEAISARWPEVRADREHPETVRADLEAIVDRMASVSRPQMVEFAARNLWSLTQRHYLFRAYPPLTDATWIEQRLNGLDDDVLSRVVVRSLASHRLVADWWRELDRTADDEQIGAGPLMLPTFLFGTAPAVRNAIRKEARRWVKEFTTSGKFPASECRAVARRSTLDLDLRHPGSFCRPSDQAWRLEEAWMLLADIREGMEYDDSNDRNRTLAALNEHVARIDWGRCFFAIVNWHVLRAPGTVARTVRGALESWDALSSVRFHSTIERPRTFGRIMEVRFGSMCDAYLPKRSDDIRVDLALAVDRMERASRDEVIRCVVPEIWKRMQKYFKQNTRGKDEEWVRHHVATRRDPEFFGRVRTACDLSGVVSDLLRGPPER